MARRTKASGGAIVFPDKQYLDGGLVVHYGQKSMETWATVVFGPLAGYIDGEVAAQYGEVSAEDWCDMVRQHLADKLAQSQE